ncbi:unnamed protein product, partial [Prorocentrum cordatum]
GSGGGGWHWAVRGRASGGAAGRECVADASSSVPFGSSSEPVGAVCCNHGVVAPPPSCPPSIAFSAAAGLCEKAGGWLCSEAEFENSSLQVSGSCDISMKLVWTRSACDASEVGTAAPVAPTPGPAAVAAPGGPRVSKSTAESPTSAEPEEIKGKFARLPYNASHCQPGLAIRGLEDCERARRAFAPAGANGSLWDVGNRSNFTASCSMQKDGSAFWNALASAATQPQLAPLCWAQGADQGPAPAAEGANVSAPAPALAPATEANAAGADGDVWAGTGDVAKAENASVAAASPTPQPTPTVAPGAAGADGEAWAGTGDVAKAENASVAAASPTPQPTSTVAPGAAGADGEAWAGTGDVAEAENATAPVYDASAEKAAGRVAAASPTPQATSLPTSLPTPEPTWQPTPEPTQVAEGTPDLGHITVGAGGQETCRSDSASGGALAAACCFPPEADIPRPVHPPVGCSAGASFGAAQASCALGGLSLCSK